ncbi:MAG: MmgE/PrpD family protein [Alphaproteobacteria bacterium]|nr:MmgE/PrpD family protein [Alphaproteobacteria bacterium]
MTTASETLGVFAASVRLDAAPDALVAKAKDHLLDTIGVACSGLAEPQAMAVVGVVRRWGGIAEAGVIGKALRLPAPKAAFLNALHARLQAFDDTHEAGPAHPGSAVVAGALAAAEAARASGRVLLESLLAGYETATRVAAALGAKHYGAGFHSTGTSAPFGAAAAAARARGLDGPAAGAALGLAGEASIGIRQYQHDGSMLDTALNGARGAELGVMAAEMAAAGLSGPRGVLDGRWGILRVMAGTTPERLTDGLGTRWEFADTSLKPYASCRFTHGPVEVLRAAKLDHGKVKSVEISTFRQSIDVADRPAPRGRAEEILSHQLAAAMALLGRDILPRNFENIDDRARALTGRVHVRHDPALDRAYPARWPHNIVVTFDDGGRVTLESPNPPRADSRSTRAKFRALAAPVLGAGPADALVKVVDEIERLPTIQPLLELLRPHLAEAA